MSSRTGRQKQMMNVVPPVTPAQRQQTQQPLQRQPQPQQRQQPPPPPQRQPQAVQIQRQPPAVQIQEKQEKQQKPKMTIGDAIGLITIRLGRVEQFIQQLQTDGIEMNSINSTQPNDFMDNGLLQNLVSRLNTIEEYSTNTATEHRLKNMETDLKDTKDLIIKLMLKFENFSDDTHAKFEEQQHQISFNLEQLQQEQQEPQEPQELQEQQELQKQEHQEPEEQDQQVTPEEALPTSSNESEHVP